MMKEVICYGKSAYYMHQRLAGKLSTRVRELFEAEIISREEARAELQSCGEKYAAWRGI